MRYPKFLPEHGTIGFVAPSFGCSMEPYRSGFKNAQRLLMEKGYQMNPGPNCYADEGIGISNTPGACAEELMDYYMRKDTDILISCGGGELMCEVLSHMDFAALKQAAPKWYMGYSDNTNLTYLLATLCDTASIYGPCAAAFGMEPWHPSLQDALSILTGAKGDKIRLASYGEWERESLKNAENPLAPYHVTEPLKLVSYIGNEPCGEEDSIEFRGRLIGGCMDCLVNLLGTRFDKTAEFVERYREDGIIWFLEACDLNIFSIRRAMWQMEEAGWLKHVKGFLIGRPCCIGQEMMGLDAYQAVLEVAGRKNVPVIMDVDIGHLPPMMPIVVGSMGEVTVKGNALSLEMQLS